MNKGMDYDLIKRLVNLMERQPETKQGYFNQMVAIKRMAKMAEVEDKAAFEDIESAREDLKIVKSHLEGADITHQGLKKYENSKQEYIGSTRKIRSIITTFRVSLGSKLVEICDNLEGLATDHELAQVIGCNFNRIKEARKKYHDPERNWADKMSFLHFALDFENVEGNKSLDWKDGLLVELITEYMLDFLTNTKAGQEAGRKFIDHLVYEEGLKTYKMGVDGQLKENYPKLKVVVDNN